MHDFGRQRSKKTKTKNKKGPVPLANARHTEKLYEEVVCSCALHLDFVIQFRSHFKQQTSIRNRDDNQAKGDCVTYLLMAYSKVES